MSTDTRRSTNAPTTFTMTTKKIDHVISPELNKGSSATRCGITRSPDRLDSEVGDRRARVDQLGRTATVGGEGEARGARRHRRVRTDRQRDGGARRGHTDVRALVDTDVG